MRIRKVRICNIHSLAGTHTLDFEAPPFRGAGLFVIAGPTGAGKSTILDAITLALYGRIARHDGNFTEVVSHGAAEAFAEVIFGMNGQQVMARWEITRKRRGANKGQLNTATRSVAVFDKHTGQWQVIAEKIREADKAIERLLGLTYEQFTRTVFLPQGAFTNFLKASARERADILEGLTGTEIYGELSKFCFQLAKEQCAAVESARNRLAELRLLTEEQIADIRARMKELQNEAARHARTIGKLQQLIDKACEYEDAQNELQRLKREIAEARAAQSEAEKQVASLKEKLSEARQALETHRAKKAELEQRWEAMQQMDHQIALQQQKVESAQKRLAENKQAQSDLDKAIALLDAQIGSLEQKRTEKQKWLDERPWLKVLQPEMKVIEQDWNRIRELEQQLKDLHEKAARVQKGIQQKQANAAQLEDHKATLENEGRQLRAALDAMGIPPEKLSDELDRLHQQQLDVQQAAHQLETGMTQLKELRETRTKAQNLEAEIAKQKSALETTKKELKQLEAQLPEAEARIREAERRRDLEMLARDLAAHRDKLQEGRPCPLCGATHHPALKHAPAPRVDEAEQHLATLKAQKDDLTEKISRRKARLDSLKREIGEKSKELRETQDKITGLEQEIAIRKNELPEPRPESEWPQWLEALKKAQAETQKTAQHLKTLAAQWKQWKASLDEVSEALKEVQRHLQSRSEELSHIQNQIEEKEKEKTALNKRIAEKISKAGVEEALSPALLSRLKSELAISEKLRKEVQDISEKLAGKRGERDEKRQRLEQLGKAVSNDEKVMEKEKAILEQFIQGRREKFGDSQVVDERKQWEDREEDMRKEEENCQHRLKDLEEQLMELKGRIEEKGNQYSEQQKKAEHTGRQLLPNLGEQGDPAKAMEEWEKLKAEAELARDELLKEKGRLEQQLADHRANEQRAGELRAELEALTREAERWQALSHLIGSAEGQKFRTLAQALTLRRLIGHANRQLARLLQGRYRLHTMVDAKSNTVNLDLYIVDQFQADTMRPVRSLSGGESFLVSLALALGLAEMAGGKIQVDSLFIDEGFGTLDDKNLDTAMEVLESLRSSGRLVGIISHVKELKERIPVQVLVRPRGGGFSTIEVAKTRLPGTP